MPTTFEEITRAYEAETRNRKPLTSAGVLPLSYEEITPAWMTSALSRSFPGAEVASLRLSEADDGTSSRRRVFLEWKPGSGRTDLPPSVFCKGTLKLENRYIIGLNGGIEAEVTFYDSVRSKLAIEAPVPYFARFDPVSLNSIVILKDATGEVRFCGSSPTLTRKQAESQLALLASLHGRFHESPELATTLASFRPWETYFTITVEKAGFGLACARGFTEAEEVIPKRLFARAKEIWPATLRCVDMHRTLPRTYIHSDVHLKNWYVAANGEMGLNDWQCSCRGHWGRDLSYGISTALSTEDRRAWEKDLVLFYVDRLHAAGGPKVAVDDAWRIYRQQLFSALAWWTGTLGQPPEAPKMQPPEDSLAFIGRMTHAIDDVEALEAF